MTERGFSRPALSVLMPVYNAEKTVMRAARSILASEFGDFEFVMVDDGSSDGTAAALSAISDERLRVFSRQHEGLVAVLNFGISKCRAAFIARMDADDFSLPDRLGKQLRYLKDEHLDAAGCRVSILDSQRRAVASWRRYEEWINAHIDTESIAAFRFVESPLVHPTVMARREVFELMYRDGPWPEDYDLWLRAMQAGFKFGKHPDCLFEWTDHPSRLTRVDARYSPDAFDRCRRMHLLNGPLRGVKTVDFWGAGATGKPWLRWLLAEGVAVRQVVEVSPRKQGQRIHSAPVISPDELNAPDGTPFLIGVGAAGAREFIIEHLRGKNYVPGVNAWFVA